MKRWHQDVHHMQKEAKVDQEQWKPPEWRHKPRPLGRYRKKHALDCGKKDCHICHFEKIYGKRTHKDYLADLKMKEQINEASERSAL